MGSQRRKEPQGECLVMLECRTFGSNRGVWNRFDTEPFGLMPRPQVERRLTYEILDLVQLEIAA